MIAVVFAATRIYEALMFEAVAKLILVVVFLTVFYMLRT